MARRQGEISIQEAATALECHEDTVRRWCQRAVNGQPSRFLSVRQDETQHYWIRAREIARMLMRSRAEDAI